MPKAHMQNEIDALNAQVAEVNAPKARVADVNVLKE